jgi:hypothetical protein
MQGKLLTQMKRAIIATTEHIKMREVRAHANRAGPGRLHRMKITPKPDARIATTDNTKMKEARPHANRAGPERLHQALMPQTPDARIATTADTKMKKASPHANRAGPESLQRMSMKPNPDAMTALPATNKSLVDRTTATASARRESIRWAPPLRAQDVRRTRTHLKRAGLWRAASATQAILGRMAARAQLVCQASTRRPRGAPTARGVHREGIPLKLRPPLRQRVILPVLRDSTLCREPLSV